MPHCLTCHSAHECGPVFKAWLRKTFPQDPEEFVNSIHSLLLLRLSTSLPFAYPFERNRALDLGAKRAFVESAPRVLQHLIRYTRQSLRVKSTPDIDPESEEIMIAVQHSQRQRKSGKGPANPASDSTLAKAFATFGIEYPPTGVVAAQEGISNINDEQLDILEVPVLLWVPFESPELISSSCISRLCKNHPLKSIFAGATSARKLWRKSLTPK